MIAAAPLVNDEAPNLTHRLLDWLDRQTAARPANIELDAWEHAVRYSRGRYEIGLEHYQHLFHELGWSGKRHGLDVGSGAGHWSIAFALDNERVTGVDRSPAFVHLANGAAQEIGLAERTRHRLGNAEALGFLDCHFDAVWAHSVLMYGIEIEDAIYEVARVLEPGGQFYCGYSSIGLRLNAIYRAVTADRQDLLEEALQIYLGATLQRDGMKRTPWTQLRCATVEELIAVCRLFGLNLLRRPGLQDGGKQFAGIPGTIDLLCVRDADPRSLRAELLELSAASESGRRRYYALVRLGLGKLVHGVLGERGEKLSDPEIGSLHALAGMRVGPAETTSALARNGLDPLVRGLLAFNRRWTADAVASFKSLPEDHPDRSFLLGAALLYAGEPVAATIEFERGVEANHRPVECEFGAMLARLPVADWSEQRDRVVRALRLLPEALAASPKEIDRLVSSLAGAV